MEASEGQAGGTRIGRRGDEGLVEVHLRSGGDGFDNVYVLLTVKTLQELRKLPYTSYRESQI